MSSTIEQQKEAIREAWRKSSAIREQHANKEATANRQGDTGNALIHQRAKHKEAIQAGHLMAALTTIEKVERLGVLFVELAEIIKPAGK
jgi:hypothetical protein